MFESFKRSWKIMVLSLQVLKKDKEMMLYPILGGVFSLLFVLAMVVPSFLPSLFGEETAVADLLGYLLIFVAYLGLGFIATFFNVCVVYTVLSRLAGQNATPAKAFKFAFKKIHLIFAWSLLSASVGLFFRILDNIAEKLGPIGKIVMTITTSILGMAWSIITIFVIPVMVYEGLGPIQSIKRSLDTLKKTWGESLIRYFALGGVQFLFVLIGIFMLIVLVFAAIPLGPIVILVAGIIFILYVVFTVIFFSVLTSIFNTMLYAYAKTGQVPEGFNADTMSGAFKSTIKQPA